MSVDQVYSQEADEAVIGFQGRTDALLISLRADTSTMFLRADVARAKRNTADLLGGCAGESIASVTIHPSDRVVTVHFVSGKALLTRLFGSKGDMLFLDSSRVVIDQFRGKVKLTGTMIPPDEGEIIYDFTAFAALASAQPAIPAGNCLRKCFPVLGQVLAREILFRAGVNVETPCGELSASQRDSLRLHALGVVGECADPKPRLYVRPDGTPALFSLLPLRHAETEYDAVLYDDVHEAVRVFLSRRRAAAGLDSRKTAMSASLRRDIEKLERTVEAIQRDAREGDRAGDYERSGTLVMSNLASLRKGDRTASLSDEEGVMTIALDPSRTPLQNAQRYFEKAKRSRHASAEAAGRLREINAKKERAAILLRAVTGVPGKEELKNFIDEHQRDLDEFGLGEKSKQHQQLPFRIFTVEGGFEVWAGKSSANNDLLTLRHAKPDDLWFHARGASGSHVVLKVATGKGEPGKKAREQAAGIAAYFSKMKGARMVPVAMTEKRYVRKPKGSAPGSVVIEREKVIFAEPALPEEKK